MLVMLRPGYFKNQEASSAAKMAFVKARSDCFKGDLEMSAKEKKT